MKRVQHTATYTVELHLQKAGPIRPRTKYKQRKLLTASRSLKIPFVPFVGLILTFSGPGEYSYAYLRVRCVEWLAATTSRDARNDRLEMDFIGVWTFDRLWSSGCYRNGLGRLDRSSGLRLMAIVEVKPRD